MFVAECSQLPIRANRLHAHQETHLPGACDVKCGKAVPVVALNARANPFLAQRADLHGCCQLFSLGTVTSTAGATHQLPPVLRDCLDTFHRLHVDGITDGQFRYPDGA